MLSRASPYGLWFARAPTLLTGVGIGSLLVARGSSVVRLRHPLCLRLLDHDKYEHPIF